MEMSNPAIIYRSSNGVFLPKYVVSDIHADDFATNFEIVQDPHDYPHSEKFLDDEDLPF